MSAAHLGSRTTVRSARGVRKFASEPRSAAFAGETEFTHPRPMVARRRSPNVGPWPIPSGRAPTRNALIPTARSGRCEFTLRFVPKPPQRKTPHDHQREAVANIVAGFRTADRGQAIMACGTGKTLVGLLVAEARARARLSSSPRPRYLPRRYASGPRTPSAPFATSRSARMRRWWARTQSCRRRASSPSTAGTTLYPRVVE